MKNNRLVIIIALFFLSSISFSKTEAIMDSQAADSSRVGERQAKIDEKKAGILCNRIDNVVSRLENNLDRDRVSSEDKNENRLREMKENRDSREVELEERRQLRDQNRESFYQKLEEKAGDDSAKKGAIEKFKTSVENAVRTRRESIDKARETMNIGIDQAIQSRETNFESLRSEFTVAVQKSISEAKNSCSTNMTNEELKNVLSDLRDDIKADRDNYKNKVNELKKVQETIQKLREDRKVAVKLAIDNFKNSIKIAQEELQSVMGDDLRL